MNKLNNLYNEKTNQEAVRQVNIDLLTRMIKKSTNEDYQKNWFLKQIEDYIEAIRATNQKLDEITTTIEKELNK